MTYLVYPHQLFSNYYPADACLVVVEDPLYFTQYRFHKQKVAFHRASMKAFCKKHPGSVVYVECSQLKESGDIVGIMERRGITSCFWVDPDDDWLKGGVVAAARSRVVIELKANPHFLTDSSIIDTYKPKRNFYFFQDFYVSQRVRLNVLQHSGKPVGGKWSFDSDNRSRLPGTLVPPQLPLVIADEECQEAIHYIEQNFGENPGELHQILYPHAREGALKWMASFFKDRYEDFGPYEDAISAQHVHNFHSVLTPFLNVGLISPREVLDRALQLDVPLNSKEGFVRQVIGWREFVRLVYLKIGREQRTKNALGNRNPIPAGFYSASTGIEPVDAVIRRVLQNAYCHHIERLMVLGNFMLLCDISPDAVYQWFMELFIDAYDWVMVPNVYGMSQYADGGRMTTKPYVSGSSYILKMSDFKKGGWCKIWDALYWRFMDRHIDLVRSNPRLGVMAGMRDKLQGSGKLGEHIKVAEEFLNRLHC